MFVWDHFMVPDDPLGRDRPHLNGFLCSQHRYCTYPHTHTHSDTHVNECSEPSVVLCRWIVKTYFFSLIVSCFLCLLSTLSPSSLLLYFSLSSSSLTLFFRSSITSSHTFTGVSSSISLLQQRSHFELLQFCKSITRVSVGTSRPPAPGPSRPVPRLGTSVAEEGEWPSWGGGPAAEECGGDVQAEGEPEPGVHRAGECSDAGPTDAPDPHGREPAIPLHPGAPGSWGVE